MNYNLHTHTLRCNHATGEDREFVETAIRAGMKTLGFSDHCPQFFPVDSYYSYFRMLPEQALEYADSVRSLQKEYRDDINILLGFETEYYPETFAPYMDFMRSICPDYMIMGQHFVGNEYDEGSFYAAESGKKEDYLKLYVSQVKEGLATGAFTYLAHPDIVWYCGSMDYYRKKMTELCVFAKENNIPLEMNMLGFLNKRCYPAPEFWDIAAEVGNKVVLGYDAHCPDMLLRTDIEQGCKAMLEERGLSVMPFEEIVLRNETL